MKEIMNHMDMAFGFLSRLVVNGDNVDNLAAARQALREAYARAANLLPEEKEVTEDGNNDRQTAEDAE